MSRRLLSLQIPTPLVLLLLFGAMACPAAPLPPGVSYVNDRIARVPWSVHVVKIERAHKNLGLDTTVGRAGGLGLSTLVEQVRTVPDELGEPIAALNGDFYVTSGGTSYAGDPRGLQISNGELVSGPTDQASFWIDAKGEPQATNVISRLSVTWPDGSSTRIGLNEGRSDSEVVLYTPRVGRTTRTRRGRDLILVQDGSAAWLPLRAGGQYQARVQEIKDLGDAPVARNTLVLSMGPSFLRRSPGAERVQAGAVLKISTAMIPDLRGVSTAVSGGFVLVRDGRKQRLNLPDTGEHRFRSALQRHPRSAIGASRDHFFLVEVDGRQPGLSMGMNLSELGDYMHKLGCELVLSLDGGASSTLWLNGRVMNSPCNGRVRPIANGIVLLEKP